MASCYDCDRPYGDEHGFPDLMVPDDVWLLISPHGGFGGLLCPSCICKRVHDAGLERVEARFCSGPFTNLYEHPWTPRPVDTRAPRRTADDAKRWINRTPEQAQEWLWNGGPLSQPCEHCGADWEYRAPNSYVMVHADDCPHHIPFNYESGRVRP